MPHKNPSPPSWMERMRGKRTGDIHLPRSMDEPRDPRLPEPSPMQAVKEALEGLREYNKRMKSMK